MHRLDMTRYWIEPLWHETHNLNISQVHAEDWITRHEQWRYTVVQWSKFDNKDTLKHWHSCRQGTDPCAFSRSSTTRKVEVLPPNLAGRRWTWQVVIFCCQTTREWCLWIVASHLGHGSKSSIFEECIIVFQVLWMANIIVFWRVYRFPSPSSISKK